MATLKSPERESIVNSLDLIHELFAHMAWADAAVWQCVLSNEKTATDPWIRERLHHVHAVQSAYFTIWTGAELDWKEPSSFRDSAAVAKWGREQHARMKAFVDNVSEGDLDRIAKLPWAERLAEQFGTVHDSTVGETLLQIPSHSTNHRGQVLMKLRELGAKAPILDFIAWVWIGKPQPVWPAE